MIVMGDEETLRVIDMLIIFSIVMVSQVHIYVKLVTSVLQNMCNLLSVKYALIKPLK